MSGTLPTTGETIETNEIQGLVLRGYGKLAARFLVLEVEDAAKARTYLRELIPRLNRGKHSPGKVAHQIAFTAKGLAALGVSDDVLKSFSREFYEGMDDELRAQILGDEDANASSGWTWGKRDEPVHALLLIYAKDEQLQAEVDKEKALYAGGFTLRHEKYTTALLDQKEHFGWRDGISMPVIAGVTRDGRAKKKQQETWTGPIPAGEFLLGYRNDYGAHSEYPTVELADDPANLLALDGVRKNLGRNGTYLVYREMTQDVKGLWNYLAEQSREPGETKLDRAIALGSKMVGRWPSGAPLVTSPDKDRKDQKDKNEFHFLGDKPGLVCPRGAHIRRSNPRDVLAVDDRGPEAAIQMVRKHQMIRRGRPFGPPVHASMDPEKILETPDSGEPRGLHFLCLVGDIGRQFEFVQRNWLHSANFDSLNKDGDPLATGRRPEGHPNQNDEFTCPAKPVRRKYKDLPPFTRLVGGQYFFLPGIAALQWIASDR